MLTSISDIHPIVATPHQLPTDPPEPLHLNTGLFDEARRRVLGRGTVWHNRRHYSLDECNTIIPMAQFPNARLCLGQMATLSQNGFDPNLPENILTLAARSLPADARFSRVFEVKVQMEREAQGVDYASSTVAQPEDWANALRACTSNPDPQLRQAFGPGCPYSAVLLQWEEGFNGGFTQGRGTDLIPWACAIVLQMLKALEEGALVFVHCKAGRGRSALLVAALKAYCENRSVQAALTEMKSVRRQVAIEPEQEIFALRTLYSLKYFRDLHSAPAAPSPVAGSAAGAPRPVLVAQRSFYGASGADGSMTRHMLTYVNGCRQQPVLSAAMALIALLCDPLRPFSADALGHIDKSAFVLPASTDFDAAIHNLSLYDYSILFPGYVLRSPFSIAEGSGKRRTFVHLGEVLLNAMYEAWNSNHEITLAELKEAVLIKFRHVRRSVEILLRHDRGVFQSNVHLILGDIEALLSR